MNFKNNSVHPNPHFKNIFTAHKFFTAYRTRYIFQRKNCFLNSTNIRFLYKTDLFLCASFNYNCMSHKNYFFTFLNLSKNNFTSKPFSYLRLKIVLNQHYLLSYHNIPFLILMRSLYFLLQVFTLSL